MIAFLLVGVSSTISGGGSGGRSSGAGTGEGFGVELVSARQAMPDALTVRQPDPVTDSDALDVQPSLTMATTADATAVEMQDQQEIAQVSTVSTVTGTDVATTSEAAAGGAGVGGQSSGINDPLWKQIEPCWRRLATAGTRGAMLRVNFSPLGNVAQFVDASDMGAIDTKSEAIASEALAQCGPYVSAGSRENVLIAFPGLQ